MHPLLAHANWLAARCATLEVKKKTKRDKFVTDTTLTRGHPVSSAKGVPDLSGNGLNCPTDGLDQCGLLFL